MNKLTGGGTLFSTLAPIDEYEEEDEEEYKNRPAVLFITTHGVYPDSESQVESIIDFKKINATGAEMIDCP